MFSKIKDWILGGLAVIGGIFGAIFYVLFQQKKTENELINQKYEAAVKENEIKTKELNARTSQEEAKVQREKEREELERKQINNSDLSNFNDTINRLQNK